MEFGTVASLQLHIHYVTEVTGFCLGVIPKPHHKQQASSSFSTSISSTMSKRPNDSSLELLSSPKKVARLHSPKPRSANDSTGAARSSSALPIMRTPSSSIRAADTRMVVTGEIPDSPSAHQVNIDIHLIEHVGDHAGHRSHEPFPDSTGLFCLKICFPKLLMTLT